jgi:hypothetical protein
MGNPLMNHYTYFLTAKEPFNGMKYYIGVRSCKNSPEEDKYLSSSKVIKRNKIAVDKHILATWDTRQEAISHEILLHDCFDVAVNKEFFNQALQTTIGFDTSGKVSAFKGKHHTESSKAQLRAKRSGMKLPEEWKRNIGLSGLGRQYLKISCPKCYKIGGINLMKRWHFDNCTGAEKHMARISVNGKRLYLGTFPTKEQAKMTVENYLRSTQCLAL